jgi:FAD-dependent oxidoreductase domain-containing protein 1
VRFYEGFDELIAGGQHVRANFRQRGYLFLANKSNAERLERRYRAELAAGAVVERIDASDVRHMVPDLRTDDLLFGVFGKDDGYADPRGILAGFRVLATSAGVEYVTGDVCEIRRTAARVSDVVLDNGNRLESFVVVNAAGPFAATVASLAGVELPVTPVRQHLFRCELPRRWPYRFPMVVDPSGVHWRHEDPDSHCPTDRIIVARTKFDEPPGFNFDCDSSRWRNEFRPPLVRRVPALARARVLDGWSGLYEVTPDHNPIIGEHPDLRGFYLANGFSGHGLMLAPAIGKVLSEMITTGRSETVDVTGLSVDRFRRDELFEDEATI